MEIIWHYFRSQLTYLMMFKWLYYKWPIDISCVWMMVVAQTGRWMLGPMVTQQVSQQLEPLNTYSLNNEKSLENKSARRHLILGIIQGNKNQFDTRSLSQFFTWIVFGTEKKVRYFQWCRTRVYIYCVITSKGKAREERHRETLVLLQKQSRGPVARWEWLAFLKLDFSLNSRLNLVSNSNTCVDR